jgi:hypothetical protein
MRELFNYTVHCVKQHLGLAAIHKSVDYLQRIHTFIGKVWIICLIINTFPPKVWIISKPADLPGCNNPFGNV